MTEYEAVTESEWKILATEEITHLSDAEKDYLPGTAVVHRAFGPGVVESRAGSLAVIDFREAGVRKVDLTACLRKGLLRLASGSPY